ncbi:unnamed protein product [Gongylonema pulchrum]|uniref:Secreted protein n=1 Tax=Gongylonema pulchrum TaxID=637853 RepID=A0A183F0P9_9BILA|nr:unnamed protein product [Gongylonema pulchrum]
MLLRYAGRGFLLALCSDVAWVWLQLFASGRDPGGSAPKKNFFSFDYYQQYFDVDTDQVISIL